MMQGIETRDYINETPRRRKKRSGDKKQAEKRLCHPIVLGFALLCIIQATLNISLRLTLYSSKESSHSDCNATRFSGNDQTEEAQGNGVQQQSGTPSPQRCPLEWREIQSKCYFLSTEMKTWDDSRKHCQSEGADLVVISSQQEQEAIYRLDGDQYLLFWIGLKGTNRVFRWVDGSELRKTFWKEGQPDHGGPNNVEDCVEMYHHNPVLSNWNDAPCGHKRRWFCEKNAHPIS
ncbi:C-type lectin domain family 4 member E-like isoform X2 [Acanthochromis polyacanthus]|uniref:C-type lectin domain family 4 member E-like isoform X2 n=1 Tax=Acanthochromis polyacanthus TaxID=80966 RepID=UPI002234D5A4|nr:C-type lectin domain family 4 member E-like isoform X2 [Acanthochromis polyacanthus]